MCGLIARPLLGRLQPVNSYMSGDGSGSIAALNGRFSPRAVALSGTDDRWSTSYSQPNALTVASRADDEWMRIAKVLGPQSTQTRRSRFSVPLAAVLCKPPFAEFVEKNRIQCKRSLQDFYQRREQNCSQPAAFKNATVRERPSPDLSSVRSGHSPAWTRTFFSCGATGVDGGHAFCQPSLRHESAVADVTRICLAAGICPGRCRALKSVCHAWRYRVEAFSAAHILAHGTRTCS